VVTTLVTKVRFSKHGRIAFGERGFGSGKAEFEVCIQQIRIGYENAENLAHKVR
jgi:hypothetical protein